MNVAIRTLLFVGLLVLLVAATSYLARWYSPPTEPPKTFTPAPAIPKLAAVPKVKVGVKQVEVIPKEIAVKGLPDLPDDVVNNDNIEITGTATAPQSKSGYEIVTTINKEDGSSSILVKEKPRKLLEFISDKRIGVAYGISSDKGHQVGKVYGEWSFLRVGDAHLSVQAEMRAKKDVEAVGMVAVDYRW